MKNFMTYRWVVEVGCLLYFFVVKADEGVTGENISNVIKHDNAKHIPESCGYHTSRIILGKKPFLGEFPWLALLKYRLDDGPQFLCEGFLISNRYVLTAAQCVSSTVYPLVGVRLGEDNINTDPDCTISAVGTDCANPIQDLAIEEVFPHPQYNVSDRNHYHDIALIRLKTTAKFSDYVQPICLPFGEVGNANLTSKKLWVAGWSKLENLTQNSVKGKARVPIVAFDQCFDKYKDLNVVLDKDKEICAGNDVSRWCGVSGSPLMGLSFESGENRWYSHGLLSFGPALCTDRIYPEIYTKIFYYLNWIVDTIRR